MRTQREWCCATDVSDVLLGLGFTAMMLVAVLTAAWLVLRKT